MKIEIKKSDVQMYGQYFLVAEVEFKNRDFAAFSKYPDEKNWLCDAFIKSNGYPVFVHGTGSRCCAKRVPDTALNELIVAEEKRAGF